jgi:hypothetical protein
MVITRSPSQRDLDYERRKRNGNRPPAISQIILLLCRESFTSPRVAHRNSNASPGRIEIIIANRGP